MESLKSPSDLGRRVHEARVAAGISARGLSRAIGASHPIVRSLETGIIQDLSSHLVLALAGSLGTTVAYLITGEGTPPTAEESQEAFKAREQLRKVTTAVAA